MHSPPDISAVNRRFDDLAPRVTSAAGTAGVVGLLASVLLIFVLPDGRARFFHAYLVSFAYFLSLALGALFFVMLQHLTRSGWSVVVRRVAETVAATLPVLGLLAIPVLLGTHDLYPWTYADHVLDDAVLRGKQAWLNVPFFVVRVVAYFLIWSLLSRFFFRTSVAQDVSGDVGLTLKMQTFSAPCMVVFALTLTFAAFDLLMSLDPHWYSTIFGVYYFSGGVLGFFALLVVLAVLLQRAGRLRGAITAEHYQDLGKLVFAFVVFWAYIAFSQYMLIWYANIPEETLWFKHRQTGQWTTVSLLLLFGHFVVPFLALISRYPKRRRRVLALAAIWVLLMHWVDLCWLVMPGAAFAPAGHVPLSLLDLTCFLGVGGVFIAAAAYLGRNRSLLAERDPRLVESLTFENV